MQNQKLGSEKISYRTYRLHCFVVRAIIVETACELFFSKQCAARLFRTAHPCVQNAKKRMGPVQRFRRHDERQLHDFLGIVGAFTYHAKK